MRWATPADLRGNDIDRIAGAVVRVVVLRDGEEVSSGSGTVIDESGLIYTNRHVVEGAVDYGIEVLDDPNELPVPLFRASLLGYSMDVDFAVLQIDRDARGRGLHGQGINLPFHAAVAREVRRGDAIFMFGYPGLGDGYLALTKGTVTTIRNGIMNDQRLPVWFQTDADIAPGNSGGLAVNARGEMIGIPTMVVTDATGGRLAGVLPVHAVGAALDGGLATDPSPIAAAPGGLFHRAGRALRGLLSGQSELNQDAEPQFATVALDAGFRPDPSALRVVGGGEIDASYLGAEGVGYAAQAPGVRLLWRGANVLAIFFRSDDGEHASVLVNLPDGRWVCNEDGVSPEPTLVLENAPAGQFDIWVAAPEPGQAVPGFLGISELKHDPWS